jgi:hypothetical protein
VVPHADLNIRQRCPHTVQCTVQAPSRCEWGCRWGVCLCVCVCGYRRGIVYGGGGRGRDSLTCKVGPCWFKHRILSAMCHCIHSHTIITIYDDFVNNTDKITNLEAFLFLKYVDPAYSMYIFSWMCGVYTIHLPPFCSSFICTSMFAYAVYALNWVASVIDLINVTTVYL